MRLTSLPPFTRAIFYLNVAIFLILNIGIGRLGGVEGARIMEGALIEYGFTPREFWAGKFWQPFTMMFLHHPVFLLHIIGNMIGFVTIGIFLERAIGTLRFAMLYFISGLFGALAILIFQPDLAGPAMGASAGVTGLLGALAVLYPRSKVLLFFIFPMQVRTLTIGAFIISIVLHASDTLSWISHLGHAAGIAGGFLYTILAIDSSQHLQESRTGRQSAYKDILEHIRAEIQKRQEQSRRGFQNPDSNLYPGPQENEYYRTADGRIERVVNPTGSSNNQASDASQTKQAPQRRAVYFDPATGRYYIQTG